MQASEQVTDRTLDALVAERVMEWRYVKVTAGYAEAGSSEIPYEHHDYWERPDLTKTHLHHFSTDIAAAWPVVDVIFKQLFHVRAKFIELLGEEINRGLELQALLHPSYWIFFVKPEHICWAALGAVGCEETPFYP